MLKRSFDLLFSFVGLILFLPLMILVAVLVRVSSPGSVIYEAIRIGRNGRQFKMYKFRTMIVDADQRGPLVTAGDDRRITPIGRILRRYKFDELPTLWNVLIGDMSLVGPRPENPKSALLYSETQRNVWMVRPGITSLATIKYRNEEDLLVGAANLSVTYFEIMQDKLRLELKYVERQSLWLDLVIIFRTMRAIFAAKNPHA